jgi:hypothetical protein
VRGVERAEVSRRLKAARWLVGSVNDKGKPRPMTTVELSAHQQLKANRITKNRLDEIEQLVSEARPVELLAIEEALGLDRWFGSASRPALVGASLRLLAGEVDQERHRREGGTPPGRDDTDPPNEAAEGGGA